MSVSAIYRSGVIGFAVAAVAACLIGVPGAAIGFGLIRGLRDASERLADCCNNKRTKQAAAPAYNFKGVEDELNLKAIA